MARTAIAVLSAENLRHNVAVVKKQAPTAKIIAMVKANAYGHGIRGVSLRLDGGVDLLGVASIDEALSLRHVGVKTPILLMEGVFEAPELTQAAAEKCHVMVHNDTQIDWLEQADLPYPMNVWLKINTGMGRLGFSGPGLHGAHARLSGLKNVVQPIRIVSHFAAADRQENPLNQQQIQSFQDFTRHKTGELSLCNSAAIFQFPDHHYDYVRPGLALYGVSPIPGVSAESLGLRPVMTLKTSLISVQTMSKGSPIGYGGRYRCPETMPVGVVAFGYGDGYPFAAADGTPIRVNDVICPLVGQVSMDMMAVDLRPCPRAVIGDNVVLWGDGLAIEDVSKHTPNITWDMLTGVQNRVKFLWTGD